MKGSGGLIFTSTHFHCKDISLFRGMVRWLKLLPSNVRHKSHCSPYYTKEKSAVPSSPRDWLQARWWRRTVRAGRCSPLPWAACRCSQQRTWSQLCSSPPRWKGKWRPWFWNLAEGNRKLGSRHLQRDRRSVGSIKEIINYCNGNQCKWTRVETKN